MRTCAAAVGAVSAVVACAIACAIAGVQVGLVVELEEIFGAPGGYSGALEVTGAPWKWNMKESGAKWWASRKINKGVCPATAFASSCEPTRLHSHSAHTPIHREHD